MEISRREFLKLSALALAEAVFRPIIPSPETNSFVSSRVYRTSDGLIPVSNYRVNLGDNITKIAERFHTKTALIIEANNLLNSNNIYPDQELKIPKYPQDLMAFIPESNIIRHIVRPKDTTYTISRRYGVPELPIVLSARAQFGGLSVGETLTLHAVEPTSIVSLDYQPEDDRSLSPAVVKSLVNRVANVFSYYLGGPDGLSYLISQGIHIDKKNPAFAPPNHVGVEISDTVAEIVVLGQLGHEAFHMVPFPWWSAGADEGTAGFVSTEWVVGARRFSPLFVVPTPWNQEGYYDSVNSPELRKRKFNDESTDFENRTLAWEAWRRIEERYPEMIANLTNKWAKTGRGQSGSHDATPVDAVSQLVQSGFGNEAWTFIESQHILFTS